MIRVGLTVCNVLTQNSFVVDDTHHKIKSYIFMNIVWEIQFRSSDFKHL